MKKNNIKKSKNDLKPQERSIKQTYKRPRIILDALVFFIILLALSISLLMISSTLKDSTTYYKEYNISSEYFEDTMQSYLGSTIPTVTYNDTNGEKTEYTGQSVEELILLDLSIRSDGLGMFNQSSLRYGIEVELEHVLYDVIGVDEKFVLIAGSNLEYAVDEMDNLIMITNLAEVPEVKDEQVVFEKELLPSGVVLGNPDAGFDKVEIKLYII